MILFPRNLDCSKKGTYNWPDDVADATVLALKDFKSAMIDFNKTIELDPDFVKAYYRLSFG